MLHLVFAYDGIKRIKEVIRPSDQVVQFFSGKILLVDVEHLIDTVNTGNTEKIPTCAEDLQGTLIDQTKLASIISDADAIKSTY